jgi:hypothetical protein
MIQVWFARGAGSLLPIPPIISASRLPSTAGGIYTKLEVFRMRKLLVLIAAVLAMTAMSATVFADCGCGGEGGGKLKPDSRPEIVTKA